MTLIDKLRDHLNKPAPPATTDQGGQPPTIRVAQAEDDNTGWKDKARALLSVAVPVALVVFGAAMAFAAFRLGEFYGQPVEFRALIAAGCALGILGHGAAVTRPTTNTSRTWHGISFGVWLVLSLFYSALYMFRSSPDLRVVIPAEMVETGGIVYSLTFAIGLVTSSVALVVPSVAERPIDDPNHKTLGAVVSKYGEVIAIGLAIATSSLHLYTFGIQVARVDVMSAVVAMVVADLTFLVAEKRVVSELKTRRESGRFDAFDLGAWGVFALVVLAYLVLVNIYAIRFTSKTLEMADPTFQMVKDFYGASPSILLLCVAALALLTAVVDKPKGTNKSEDQTDGQRVNVVTPSWAHRVGASVARPLGLVEDFRRGMSAGRGAAQLPAPTPTASMGQDAPTAAPTITRAAPITEGRPLTRADVEPLERELSGKSDHLVRDIAARLNRSQAEVWEVLMPTAHKTPATVPTMPKSGGEPAEPVVKS